MSMAFIYGFILFFFLILLVIEYGMYKQRKINREIWEKIFKEEYDAPTKRPEDLK